MTTVDGRCLGNTNDQCVDVGLSAVSETTLWTLHNRVSVARNPEKTWFDDNKAIEIYDAIGYDYEESFGKASESSGIRSWLFDQAILDFWKNNPGGTIVNFAEGLETQRFRLQESRPDDSLWITVDLPPGINAREQFILPDSKNLHVAASILDTDQWMHLVPKEKPVFFTAQGLIMYIEEDDNRELFLKIAQEFPSSAFWFDSIAKWLSDKTMGPAGWKLSDHYTTPKMPFGVNKGDALEKFKSWVPNVEVEEVRWPMEKSDGFFNLYVVPILMKTPFIQNLQPGMVVNLKFPPLN